MHIDLLFQNYSFWHTGARKAAKELQTCSIGHIHVPHTRLLSKRERTRGKLICPLHLWQCSPFPWTCQFIWLVWLYLFSSFTAWLLQGGQGRWVMLCDPARHNCTCSCQCQRKPLGGVCSRCDGGRDPDLWLDSEGNMNFAFWTWPC